MKLTPFQYQALKIYRRYHANGLTVSQVLWICWWQWALLVGWAAIAYFLVTPHFPSFGYLVVGLAGGALLRDMAYYRMAFRLWPVNREIYDWKRVSELIALHENSAGL